MKLTKRNGVYVLDYRDPLGKRKRVSTGTRDRGKAEIVAHEIMSGRDTRGGVWTVTKALDHALKHVWADAKSFRTFYTIAKQLKVEIGHLPVNEVTYAVLTDWVTMKKREDLKPATMNRRLSALRRALVECVKQGVLHAVPEMPRQLENNKRLRFLSEDEEVRLMTGCGCLVERDAVLMRHVIAFLIDTGARQGEMLGIMPTDIRTARGPGKVNVSAIMFKGTKSKADQWKSRSVPLTPRALEAAKEITKLNECDIMWTPDQLRHRFDRAAVDAKLDGVTRHTLRHTCASRLVQRGADIYRVKEWLGHSNVAVTERYAHLADTNMDDMAGLLEDVTHTSGLSHGGHSATNVTQLRRKNVR